MTTKTQTVKSTANREISISRILNAPRELVWEVWTDPKHIDKWWGPIGFSTETHEMKVQQGSKWLCTMHGPNGMDFHNEFTYTEVVKPELIVYTHAEPTFTATVTFENFAGKTKLTMCMVFDSVDVFNSVVKEHGAIEGQVQTINRLEALLAEMQPREEFTISREFKAPRELVYKVFSQAEHLAKWWGPPGASINVKSLNFSPGGMFHYSMQSPMGEMWGKFVYCEMTKPERVVFISSFSDEKGGVTPNPFMPNWPLETLNIMTLTEHDGKTTLSMRGGPINATEEQMNVFNSMHGSMQQGFAGTFNQLDEYLSKIQ
ncbi:MAG TPA: SRPBCC family protein [Bacteroidia bacterium]|nr:SRPBCC family protein [Bacteroidia bacterium]